MHRWLDRLAGQPDPEAAPTDKEREQREEGLQEKLERQARELGYARVAAEHLITGRPRLSIGELKIEGLQAMQLGGKAIDIVGSNLSTHPYLVDEPPRLSIRARDGTVLFDVTLAGASKRGGVNKIELVYKGLPGDAIGQRLKGEPIKGGTIDFEAKGTWQLGGKIDLPFQVRLNGTTLTLPGSGKSEKIDRLDLPLRIYGSLDDPRVLFREKDLANALVAAGKKELAGRLGAELDKKLGDDVKKKLGDLFK